MTVVAAWVRRIHNVEELVFASDSRLSGDGRVFDSAPKIFALARGDCAIAFSGYTWEAFPMMSQFELALRAHKPLLNRSIDLYELKTYVLKLFDILAHQVKRDVKDIDILPTAKFLFGGYSWIKRKFFLWKIYYKPSEGQFVAEPARYCYFSHRSKHYSLISVDVPRDKPAYQLDFIGDYKEDTKARLIHLLSNKYPLGDNFESLDWEPLEVLISLLNEKRTFSKVGGAPQILRVHSFMQCTSVAVYWPDEKSGKLFLQGRPRLPFEKWDCPVFNPEKIALQKFPTTVVKAQYRNVKF